MKKQLLPNTLAVTLIAMLCSCSGSNESYRMSYLAVQMEKNADWSIIDKDGQEVVKEEYPADAKISQVSDDGSFWVKDGSTYQLFSIDQPKKPINDDDYTRVTNFYAGVAAASMPNSPIRIIDTQGKVVATLNADIKRCFSFWNNGYAFVLSQDNCYGIIDKDGKTVLKPAYADVAGISDDWAVVKQKKDDTKWVIINMKGEKQGEVNTEKYTILSVNESKIIASAADNNSSNPIVVLDKTGQKLFDIKKAPGDKNPNAYYRDDYLVFTDAGGKKGVVDENGEVQIRGRYEEMYNLGRGEFVAMKGDKWGVVDANDETLVDFAYSDSYLMALGDNFLMRDGNTWLLMSKENKEIITFAEVGGYGDSWAEYINIDRMVEQTAKMLEDFEKPKTGKDLAEELNLNIDDYHYGNSIVFDDSFDDKVSVSLKMLFFNNLAEEKTHTVKESDGWFTYDKTISDGWFWRTELFSIIEGDIKIGNDIDFTSFATALDKRLKQTHQEIGEGEYTRTANDSCQTVFRLKLEHTAGGLNATIQPETSN